MIRGGDLHSALALGLSRGDDKSAAANYGGKNDTEAGFDLVFHWSVQTAS